jgi:hypothetical protein
MSTRDVVEALLHWTTRHLIAEDSLAVKRAFDAAA